MAKLSLPQGEGVHCVIAQCLSFPYTVTKSITAVLVSEIVLSITELVRDCIHHIEQDIQLVFLSKKFSVASCGTCYLLSFLSEGLPQCSVVRKQLQIAHGLIKYFPQVTVTELFGWFYLKSAKLCEVYAVL